MRKVLTSLFPVLILSASAQTFNGTGGAITNNGVPTPFVLNVTGLSGNLSNSLGLEEVCLDITHPDMSEITVSLMSPGGVVVELVNSTSLKGANFSSTCFNSGGSSSITKAAAPYSGNFKPTGYIGRFNTGTSGNGNWTLFVKDYFPNGNSGTLNNFSLKFSATPAAALNFSTSNLPLVFLSTNGQAITTNTILIDLGIVDNVTSRNSPNDPRYGYQGKATLNIRGSSSQIFEKKAFKLDLRDATGNIINKVPILGMPAESDWVLTPSYSDKTLIRNALSQQIFREMGHYTPRTRFVELFVNNEYFGVYTLLEKPKVGTNRVDINKMSDLDNTYPYVTGGYLLQINRFDPLPNMGWNSLFPGNSVNNPPDHFFYQQEYPKPEEITNEQKQYIKAVLDSFETVMNGPNFADPVTGYRKWIDVLSWADFFILTEFSKNIDGYKLSTYLYKDNVLAGGKLVMGPAWDYDIAWHNANYGGADFEQWWQYMNANTIEPIPWWWSKLMTDDYFKNMVNCRWQTLRKNVLSQSNIYSIIDDYSGQVNEAQERNFIQFPILDAIIFPNPPGQVVNNYKASVDDLKSWVVNRGTWLDQNVPGSCKDAGIGEYDNAGIALMAYPNPFDNKITIFYSLPEETEVRTEIVNTLGQMIQVGENTRKSPGDHEEEIDLRSGAAGTYLLKVQAGKNTYFKKIIKTQTP
jgi:subtilisin-like proprotein convertase family protein